MGDKDLTLIGRNIKCLLDVLLSPAITSLNLHCNHIQRIEGLTSAWNLQHLDLSSNYISNIEGLSSLTYLRTLNLSCNLITKVEGLTGLVNLTRLNLAYNQINNVTGLLCLHGMGYRLKYIFLQGNHIDGIDHLLKCLLGLQDLREVTLSKDDTDNPVCRLTGYREIVMQSLPQVSVLDGLDKLGNPSHGGEGNPCDIPGLEDYVDFLLSSDMSHEAPTGYKSSSSIHSVVTLRKAKRDTDRTSESECDSGKENRRQSRIPKLRNSVPSRMSHKKNKDHSDQETQKSSLSAVGAKRKACGARSKNATEKTRMAPSRAVKTSGVMKPKSTEEEETYRAIVEERDQERERRWKAEQAVRKLTEDLKSLQTKVRKEKDQQSMALHTTDRLKELLLKERSGCAELQTCIDELQLRCQSLNQQLEHARSNEKQHMAALHRLEENISQGEALRAHQKNEEIKRHQELENKATSLKRELDIQRALVRRHQDKVQQLHELLATKDQEHRKQLENGTETASMEQKHAMREAALQEKLEERGKQYAALEDEFRMALTIEAARFSEVKDACDHMTSELLGLKATLAQSQQREKKSGSLVRELTAMVKEQKTRISELIKAKRDAVTDLKGRLLSLEAQVQKDRHVGLQLELLKKEKAQLFSQLTAQESLVDGLKAERRIWGQELAQQGVSLAQDRGRLEARIEVLGTELETQKKQNERDSDALKIKAKIIDDQTETIRKLKEALQERDAQIHRLREEGAQAQKRLQQQQEEKTAQQVELREQLEHLSLRKEELKQQLEDKDAELEEVKQVYSASSKKWQEKTDLLSRLESQVKRMKENFDVKERLLLQERDKATEAHKAAVNKLHCVNDAFHRQLESVQTAHQADMLRLTNEKQEQIQQANQKVFDVEEEMRQLLKETETIKINMKEKMNHLTSFLSDF
ncbi:leucine-rich repeat and coiled-coil domain-containing protein 1 isoform X2 [Antennarius striatus]|uniref:leucine-rich repeat and coiled-coil domain-containing protein 1 isoform X2 n=1 Tax=Antennarius striatus TaxID=241820 RepID=UPI0035B12B4C